MGSQFIYPGSSESEIILDDVICQGHEQSLLACAHNPLFTTDCDHLDVAGVSCEGNAFIEKSGDDNIISFTQNCKHYLEVKYVAVNHSFLH